MFIERSISIYRDIGCGARSRLPHERALSHLGVEQSASPRLSIRPRHRRQIDVERMRQRTMGRKLLTTHQPPVRHVGPERVHDADVHRAGPFRA